MAKVILPNSYFLVPFNREKTTNNEIRRNKKGIWAANKPNLHLHSYLGLSVLFVISCHSPNCESKYNTYFPISFYLKLAFVYVLPVLSTSNADTLLWTNVSLMSVFVSCLMFIYFRFFSHFGYFAFAVISVEFFLDLLRTAKNMLCMSMSKFHLTCVFSMLRCCCPPFAFQHFENCAPSNETKFISFIMCTYIYTNNALMC